MPLRTFDTDADLATRTALPVPRGLAIKVTSDATAPQDEHAVRALLESLRDTWAVRDKVAPPAAWSVDAVPPLAGWYQMTPPDGESIPLGTFWELAREVGALPGIEIADPLFVVSTPQAIGKVEAEAFALGHGQEQFGLWGLPHSREVTERAAVESEPRDWHLAKLNVRDAWTRWQQQRGADLPGHGIVVGHPDTGYTEHLEIKAHILQTGLSFLLDQHGFPEPQAVDDLMAGLLLNPGHGTATASVIASGEHDQRVAENHEAYGVAPGAQIMPLRVSRSVIHFDFSNVGNAILYAAEHGADVISMSLGGTNYSRFLHECVRYAHARGVIIVSAAGNNAPTTVFPAALPEIVAVAATNAAGENWRFSGLGPLVDIAAPGENVWCARVAAGDVDPGLEPFRVDRGTGTSFATACVAGIAALWLSYWGGRQAIADDAYGGDLSFVPLAFQYLLAQTADTAHEFVAGGKHGAGIANADALLAAGLPDIAVLTRFRDVLDHQQAGVLTVFTGLFPGLFELTDQASVRLSANAAGEMVPTPIEDTAAVRRSAEAQQSAQLLLDALLGKNVEALTPELLARIAADRLLLVALQRWRFGQSMLPLIDRLLLPHSERTGPALPPTPHGAPRPPDLPTGPTISADLARALRDAKQAEEARLRKLHTGNLVPGVRVTLPPQRTKEGAALPAPPEPAVRQLRAYAFDPSLATKLSTAPIHQVTIHTRWEPGLLPGPVGEYLEVVDVDPSSGCAYSPVDLNHPHVLGQAGLPPSEGSPQFHQQMVYAVAMNTIHRFEMALGRPIFWSPVRPWLQERPEERSYFTPESLTQLGIGAGTPNIRSDAARRDRYVQRLRIYPHALREANAYYSPKKRALLFGYFPGADDDTGRHYPGGMVFTCLSHDIVAHETTHALLDGMHPYFNEPTNVDVTAFHEAFSDIMALFQHFTYPEVLAHQIANTRGDLETNNLLAQLAQQFGEATGQRGALRNALGAEDKDGTFKRAKPDPHILRSAFEPHKRGSILIAAVFDAFLSLYNDRVADLLRISTGGTGVLPAGRIHPDLVSRLAREAASTAEEVLEVCIRALDYVPPVDITFGEFLRALITADFDLAPYARRTNRIAFIDAFRSWGIYPRDVPSLSEDSLLWRPPGGGLLTNLNQINGFADSFKQTLERLVPKLEAWKPGAERATTFNNIREVQWRLNKVVTKLGSYAGADQSLIPGIDLRPGSHFSIGNVRPARRVTLRGDHRTEMVVELVQTYRPKADELDAGSAYRGGATLIVDMHTWEIRYSVYKRLWEKLPVEAGGRGLLAHRFARDKEQRARGAAQMGWQGEDAESLSGWLASTYACKERVSARRKKQIEDEPFALLHRGAL